MKYLILILFFLNIYNFSFSQVQDKKISDQSNNSIMLELILKPTSLDDKTTMLSGLRFGYSFDKSIVVSISGYGLPLENIMARFTDSIVNNQPVFDMNYIGFEAEYLDEFSFLRYSLSAFFGYGSIGFDQKIKSTSDGEPYNPDYGEGSFYIFEPEFNIYLNSSSWIRVGIGGGYRMIFTLEYSYNDVQYSDKMLNGLFGVLNLSFGSF